ncbi:MAG TPA: Ig-like domain-containing protein [Verrucomicrobiales bacterium]|nr:Ig-like domain-containing protein [Verrucomicrobiales bacterium]
MKKTASLQRSALLSCLALALAAGSLRAQSLSVTTGLQLWLKADAGVATDGANVLSWSDQSPSVDAGIQIASSPGTSNSPQLVTNALNGKPVIHFDGIDDYLNVPDTASLSITGDLTTFFVVKFDDFATYRSVWAKTSGNLPAPTDYYVNPGTARPIVYRGGGQPTGLGSFLAPPEAALPATAYLVAGFSLEGTTCRHLLGGQITATGTINAVTADSDTQLIIGSRADQVTKMKGDIAEILIYDRALTDPERASVAGYLAEKWGLTNALPTVSLAATPAGPAHTTGDTLTLTATAADSDGSIARVEFLANGTPLGTATAPPFSMKVKLETPGTYTFTARAVDNRNGTAESTPVARAASGGPPPALGVTSALQLWLKADAGVTKGDGDVVLSWNDQSGKGNNATSPGDTTAPVVAASAINSLPAIRFDGLDDELTVADSPSVSITGDITSFFVVKMDDFDNYRAVWGKTAGADSNIPAPTDYYTVLGTGIPRLFRGDGTTPAVTVGTSAFKAGVYQMAGFTQAGTAARHFMDGFPNGAGTITAPIADADTPLYIGTRLDRVTRMKGDIAEVLIYDAALSEADLRSVQVYLAGKYAMPMFSTINDAPAVTVTAPAAGGSVVAPADVTLSANASDADGSVAKVEFLINGAVVGTDTTSPYSVVVNLPAPGAVTVTVRATDNLGAVTLSAPVNFTATTAEPIPLPNLANLRLWLRADKGVVETAGGVSAWNDQSGNFNNAVQSIAGQRPVLVPNAINGRPALRFDGTDDSLAAPSTPSLAITGDISSIFVVKFDDYLTFRAVWGKTAGAGSNIPASTDFYTLPDTGIPQVFRGNGAGGNPSAGLQAATAGDYAMIGFDMAGTTITHSLNGGYNGQGQITAALADGGTPLYIGTRHDQFTRMKGEIAEVIIYGASLSETDKSTLYSYLATRYGITLAPPPPPLTIVRNNDGTITVSWPAEATGYGLESSTDPENFWVPEFPLGNTFTEPAGSGKKFYRLRRM